MTGSSSPGGSGRSTGTGRARPGSGSSAISNDVSAGTGARLSSPGSGRASAVRSATAEPPVQPVVPGRPQRPRQPVRPLVPFGEVVQPVQRLPVRDQPGVVEPAVIVLTHGSPARWGPRPGHLG